MVDTKRIVRNDGRIFDQDKLSYLTSIPGIYLGYITWQSQLLNRVFAKINALDELFRSYHTIGTVTTGL